MTGFDTWCTWVYELSGYYAVGLHHSDSKVFKTLCKEAAQNKFKDVLMRKVYNMEVTNDLYKGYISKTQHNG